MDHLCWICGKPANNLSPRLYYDEASDQLKEWYVESSTENPWGRYYCDDCLKRTQLEYKKELELYIKLKKKLMFIRACNLLEKQGINMYEYKDAITVVEEHIKNHPDKFDSSYEVVAAIILVYNHVLAKMQYKIGKYQVDFLLPEMCTVLEIDGERHRHKKEHDSKRDQYIKKCLGGGWQIVRIKTDYLDKNADKLIEAIDKVLDYRDTHHINWRELYKSS